MGQSQLMTIIRRITGHIHRAGPTENRLEGGSVVAAPTPTTFLVPSTEVRWLTG